MKRKNRTILTALCAVVLAGAVFFAGCDGSEANQGGDGEKTFTAQLYYVNEAYVLDGDEGLGHFMPPVEKELSPGESGAYMAVIDALAAAPEEKDYGTILRNNITVNSAAADEEGKVITVDFQSQGLTGGSTEETLLVEQIVWTMLKTFDAEKVRFTVDGKGADSLMGHLDASVPYRLEEADDGSGKEVEMVMPVLTDD